MDARDCEVTVALRQSDEFAALVGFHGCYCLDIALGYRVAAALLREMGDEMSNLKHVVAYVGAPTCAIAAIQHVAGCTMGKRNLHYTVSGNSTFVLHNAVRMPFSYRASSALFISLVAGFTLWRWALNDATAHHCAATVMPQSINM